MVAPQSYQARSTKRDNSAARRTIDVWAAVRRHSEAGGTGFPEIEEIFKKDDVGREYLMSDVSGLRESDRMQDADRRKYRRSPSLVRMPIDTLNCVVVLEQVLNSSQAEPWFRRFLVCCWPERGAFSVDDQDASADCFIAEWAGPLAAKSATVRHLRRGLFAMSGTLLNAVQDRLDSLPNLVERTV